MGKPRPALVVQSDLFNELHPSVTICPISSHMTGDYLYRVPINNIADTGLLWESEVEVDKVTTVWSRRIGQRIGQAPDEVMAEVAIALRRWLTF
jgi:mRNA interferase MazF